MRRPYLITVRVDASAIPLGRGTSRLRASSRVLLCGSTVAAADQSKRSPRSFVSFHRRAQPTAGSWALAFLRISGGSLKGRLHALPCFPRTVQLLVVCWQQPACPPAPPDGRKRLGRLRCRFCGHKQLLRSLRRSSQASPASALLAWAPAEALPPLPAAPPPPTARLRLAPPRLAGWAASTARMRE